MKLRAQLDNFYNLDPGLACKDKTLTQQHFAEEVDINTIVRRFNLTGQLPEAVAMPTYADFEEIFDFQTAMNTIRAAQEAFMAMPHPIRTRFHNDPAEFVAFCSDPENRPEAAKMGLVERKPEGEPSPTTPPAASPSGLPTPEQTTPKVSKS